MAVSNEIDREQLFVLWGDGSIHGFIDGLPNAATLLNPALKGTTRRHRVRFPSGHPYGIASYVLRSNGATDYADLDYTGVLKAQNITAGMDIGVLRLHFLGPVVADVEWRYEHGKQFSKAAAIALRAAEMARLQKAWAVINQK